MKQIKIPAMLLALGLTLTACAAGQKTFQRGSVEGRTYTSEFLGLTCTAPEEFAYLSDQEIAEILSARNICISRRTVAKYRKEMCISTTYERKYSE